jgi:hypothetical protein
MSSAAVADTDPNASADANAAADTDAELYVQSGSESG